MLENESVSRAYSEQRCC